MRTLPLPVLSIAVAICFSSCKNDSDYGINIDPAMASLVESLDNELEPLSPDPLQWSDDELSFLDEVSDQAIVGLGEATHGTSEFFKAKHRIFRYMVENHGFKIFAIEADFGESVFINEAVINSDKGQISQLMKDKMHFWTWRTNEVRDMLYWMCDYNQGKADNEKVQYWGIDCQFNTYHPQMAKEHLSLIHLPFLDFANDILDKARLASNNQFANYSKSEFDSYLEDVTALKDSLTKYKADIIDESSEKHFAFVNQLVELTRQVSEVIYYNANEDFSRNYRDEYMAKNTGWLYEFFGGTNVVLWAHNYHVSDHGRSGAMGHHLKADFPSDYTSVGFLFSKGNFTAVTFTGNQTQGLNKQTLDKDPKTGSLNYLMSHAKAPVFTVAIDDLQKDAAWNDIFQDGIDFFHMGATYTNKPLDYYMPFDEDLYDRLIYFDLTTAAVQLN